MEDFENAETVVAMLSANSDVMAMLEAISARLDRAERLRAEETREWSAWRGKMDAAVSNLAERAGELRTMYAQVVEILPIAKRTESHVAEIANWMHQGGYAAKRISS